MRNLFSAGRRILQGTKTIHDSTGQPVSENCRGEAHFENFIMGSEITEFVNKVRNQVRIRQKRMSNDAEDCTEHSIVWGMFMATTLNAVTFMGKSYSTMPVTVALPAFVASRILSRPSWSLWWIISAQPLGLLVKRSWLSTTLALTKPCRVWLPPSPLPPLLTS